MRKFILALVALFAAPFALADSLGVVNGTTITMVPAAASTVVAQCVAASQKQCWPSFAATMAPSVPFSSLPSTAYVWAQVGAATAPAWVLASAVTVTALAATPVPADTSAVLTWSVVTTGVDGSTLTGAVTYNVYRGTSATTLTSLSAGLTALTYTDSGLAPGVWYYAVTAVCAALESDKSAVVSKAIVAPAPVKPIAPVVIAK